MQDWYKDAIIYEVHVRAFFDSVTDGIGDFGGLTQKLPYLEDLGVTAIWLLPFCPSPLIWVLEIHIRHPTEQYGAFFEDMLLDDGYFN